MILVSGATGFLGSELIVQLLRKGERVRAIKRPASVIPEILSGISGIEWVEADMLNYFELKQIFTDINKVYHCAAMVSFDPADRKEMLRFNVESTRHLLNLSMEAGIQKFMHVSSVAAVGNPRRGRQITEKLHWEFNGKQSAYSISKYQSEMEVFRADAEGLPCLVVNPGIIIGKNAGNRGSGQLIESVRKGLKYYPGGSFGFVDVEDVARIMIRLMDLELRSERYILIAGNLSYRELFTEAAKHFGKNAPTFELKPWMLELAYQTKKILRVFGLSKSRLSRDTVRSAFTKRKFSNEKIRNTLNYEFKPLDQSLKEIAEHYK